MSYCPYCNATGFTDLTDEHVIPKSIGGDSRTLIKVCKQCNNTIGRSVDTMLSSDGWMRMNASLVGGIASRHDQLETTTTLKDGRRLEGYFNFLPSEMGIHPGFTPKKYQPDGTIWLSEDQVPDPSLLPQEINIFRREMVEYWGFYCPPSRLSGMEPAMIKVLLGIIYMDEGQSVVSSTVFDIFRSSLRGTLNPKIVYRWLDKPMTWDDGTVINNHEHAVYFECPDRKLFRAGVALFGTGITFKIPEFNLFLPKRCVRWAGRLSS